MMTQIQFKKVLREIYHVDKTPTYDYSKGKNAKNAYDKLPSPGKRWLTPNEIINSLLQIQELDIN
jgi:hypothetical protein